MLGIHAGIKVKIALAGVTCPKGWRHVGQYCHIIVSKKSTSKESAKECANMGGHMTTNMKEEITKDDLEDMKKK